jgi:predicted MFS family arabinose efflux permease
MVVDRAHTIQLRRRKVKSHIRRRDLFRYRDFRLAISAQGSSQVADAMSSLGLAQILLFDITGGDTTTSFLKAIAVASFPLFLAGPLAGHLSDRVSRKGILSHGHKVRAAITALSIIASVYSLALLGYTVFALLLLTSRVLYTARAVSIPQLVDDTELVAADSTSLTVSMFAGMIGAGLASVLSFVSIESVFIAATLLHLVSSHLYNEVHSDLGGGGKQRSEADWKMVLQQMKNSKIRFAMVSSGMSKMLVGLNFAAVATMVDARFDLQASGYAAVLGISGVGTFAGNLSAEWMIERFKRRAVSVLSAGMSALVLLVAISVSHFGAAVFSIAVASFCFQNVRICNDAAVQANVLPSALGRVFAAYDVVYNLSFVGGAAAGLAISNALGYWSSLWTGACCYAALTFGLLLTNDRDAAPSDSRCAPAKLHPSALSTLRVSKTTGRSITAATSLGSISAYSRHSVSTTSTDAAAQAATGVPA